MLTISRRALLQSCCGAAACAGMARAAGSKLRIGVTDWNLKLTVKPEAVPLAARLGFDGVQVSCGRKVVDGKLPLDNPALIGEYRRLAAEHHIALDGTCADRLHDNGLKSDPLAVRWASDAIRL